MSGEADYKVRVTYGVSGKPETVLDRLVADIRFALGAGHRGSLDGQMRVEAEAALDALAARLQAAEEERDEYMQQWATLEFLDYWQTIGRSCSAGEAIRQLLTEKQAAEERAEKAEGAIVEWQALRVVLEARLREAEEALRKIEQETHNAGNWINELARAALAAQETDDLPLSRDSGIPSA